MPVNMVNSPAQVQPKRGKRGVRAKPSASMMAAIPMEQPNPARPPKKVISLPPLIFFKNLALLLVVLALAAACLGGT